MEFRRGAKGTSRCGTNSPAVPSFPSWYGRGPTTAGQRINPAPAPGWSNGIFTIETACGYQRIFRQLVTLVVSFGSVFFVEIRSRLSPQLDDIAHLLRSCKVPLFSYPAPLAQSFNNRVFVVFLFFQKFSVLIQIETSPKRCSNMFIKIDPRIYFFTHPYLINFPLF